MDEDFAALASREEVKDQLTRLFVSMDEERWADAADCFAEKVLLDLSSTGVGKPSRTTRKKAAEMLEAGQKGLAAVQHQTGNVLVDISDEGASAFCYCTESRYFPNPTGESTYTLVGSYEFHLSSDSAGWTIDALRFKLKYAYGNALLSELAKKASKRGRKED